MRKYLSALLTVCLLAGCTGKPAEETKNDPAVQNPASNDVNEDKTEDKEQIRENFFESYYSELDEENIYDEYLENDFFDTGEQTLTLKDIPENAVESLILDQYYYSMNKDFEALKNIMGSQTLKISAESEEKNDKKGFYMKDIIIHDITTLEKEDYSSSNFLNPDAFIKTVMSDVEENELTAYTVVLVEIEWTYSEEMLKSSPQVGEGRYYRLFLAGQSEKDNDWKIYECYWGEHSLLLTGADK